MHYFGLIIVIWFILEFRFANLPHHIEQSIHLRALWCDTQYNQEDRKSVV